MASKVAQLYAEMDVQDGQFRRKLSLVKNDLASTSSQMGALGSVAGKVFAGFTAVAVVTGLASIGKQAVQTASEFEQLRVSFEVLTQSPEIGNKLTEELINLANVTPMTTEGLSQNAKLLLSFGEAVENITPDLKMLGDVAGGNQERMNSLALAFAQAGSAGRLQGQDLLQMINAGFNPLNEISRKTGKSMGELRSEMEKGQIPFSMLRQAFIDATSEGGKFYKMMDKQSQTLQGRLSTLADKWKLVGNSIGNIFLPAAKKAVEWLTKIGDKAFSASEGLRKYLVYQGMIKSDSKMEQSSALQKKIDDTQALISQGKARYGDDFHSIGNELENNLKKYKKEQKALIEATAKAEINPAGKGKNQGFQDSSKTDSTKNGKSADSILNEKASLLKAQSDLEIASNDYTDAQILQKKIELQEKLVNLYKSTSTKGKAEQLQAQTELITLEKQYQQQVIDERIKALQQEAAEKKIYAQMDTSDQLSNMSLTEQQIQNIKNQSTLAQLQAEIRLQQQILDLKSYGVDDISKLSQKELGEYNQALLDKLNAERAYQEQLAEIKNQERQRNEQVATDISDTITDGLKSAIDGTKSLSEAFSDMLATMAIDLARTALKQQLTSLFNMGSQSNTTSSGVSSGGGFFSTILKSIGPIFGFASGGTPPVNRPSLVGEEGPELFVPRTNGTVIPADQTAGILNGGGGKGGQQSVVPIILTQNINTQDARSFQQYLAQNGKQTIADMFVDMIKTDYRGVRRATKSV